NQEEHSKKGCICYKHIIKGYTSHIPRQRCPKCHTQISCDINCVECTSSPFRPHRTSHSKHYRLCHTRSKADDDKQNGISHKTMIDRKREGPYQSQTCTHQNSFIGTYSIK